MAGEGEKFIFLKPERGHRGRAHLILPERLGQGRVRFPAWCRGRRDFSPTDLAKLQAVLPKYGYDLVTDSSSDRAGLMKHVEEISVADYDDCDSLLLIISLPGNKDQFWLEGGMLHIKDILEKFLPASAPNLAKKPKIFIFQVCNQKDYTFHDHDPCPRYVKEASEAAQTLTTGSEMAVIHNPIPGRVLWRKGEHGSMMFDYLCEVLEEAKEPIDIQKVYQDFSSMMDEELSLQAEGWYTSSDFPLPVMVSSLTKTFCLERKKEEKMEEGDAKKSEQKTPDDREAEKMDVA